MRKIVFAVLGVLIAGLFTSGPLHAQAQPQPDRAVFLVLPDDFRAPERFGGALDVPQLNDAAGLIIPWNDGADMVVMNPDRLDPGSLFVTLRTLLGTRRGSDVQRDVVMAVRDSDRAPPGRSRITTLLDEVRNAPSGWVEGLGAARVVKFDHPRDLAAAMGGTHD